MLYGHDIIWAMIQFLIMFGWFALAGLIVVFVIKFKPTRKFINKYIARFELY